MTAGTVATSASMSPERTRPRPKVLLADDHAMVVAGLSRLLQAQFDLVGTARDGRELLEMARTRLPDVVVTDISMPRLNGLDAAKALRETHPQIKVVFLTMHADVNFATEAFRAGALGYLLKHSAAEELLTAVNEAIAGRVYVTPLVSKSVLTTFAERPDAHQGGVGLTPRQREVLQLVAAGRTMKEIAKILGVSPRTVEFHKKNLVRHLGLKTTAELTQYAVKRGLVFS